MSASDIQQAVTKARTQICRWIPYLSGAVIEIPWRFDESLGDKIAAGTDGANVLVGTRFCGLPTAMATRVYLHQLVHVLYGHLEIRAGSTESDWNIAIDLAAERIVAAMVGLTPLAAADPHRGTLDRLIRRVQSDSIERIHVLLRTHPSMRERVAACPKDSPCPLGEGHRMPEPEALTSAEHEH